jgi:2-dehydro-3-deoxyphosphogluconate aldolase/(4S)-4-hydroxy-2-oxoglutarate aldolase
VPHPLLDQFRRHSLVAVVRTESTVAALALARSLVAGGFRLIEVTLTTPGAEAVVAELRRVRGVVVGCGTVLSPEDAHRVLDWGAEFVVSPHTDEQILEVATRRGALAVAGALTPTEIVRAWRAGAGLIKVFPISQVGGIAYLRALRCPLPDVPLMPTGGIGADDFLDYLAAGAAAVGLGQALTPEHEVREGRWGEIAGRASDWLAQLDTARVLRSAV